MRRIDVDVEQRHWHVPLIDVRRARLVVVPWLMGQVIGITVGRWMFVRRGCEHDAQLIAHELVHVRQWRELGAPRFLWRYLYPYLRDRARGRSHGDAYRAIPAEVEARRLTSEVCATWSEETTS